MRKLRWTKTVPRKPGYYWVRKGPANQKPFPAHNAGREWTFIGTDQAAAAKEMHGFEFMKMEPPKNEE